MFLVTQPIVVVVMVMASLPLPASSLVELHIYLSVAVVRMCRALMGTMFFLCLSLVIGWSMVMCASHVGRGVLVGVSHTGRGVVVGTSMRGCPVPLSVMMLLRTSVQRGS